MTKRPIVLDYVHLLCIVYLGGKTDDNYKYFCFEKESL